MTAERIRWFMPFPRDNAAFLRSWTGCWSQLEGDDGENGRKHFSRLCNRRRGDGEEKPTLRKPQLVCTGEQSFPKGKKKKKKLYWADWVWAKKQGQSFEDGRDRTWFRCCFDVLLPKRSLMDWVEFKLGDSSTWKKKVKAGLSELITSYILAQSRGTTSVSMKPPRCRG